MNGALTWVALGAAALLTPAASPPARRARSLASRGRLGSRDRDERPVRSGAWSRSLAPFAAGAAAGLVVAVGAAGGIVLGTAAAVALATGGRLASRAVRRRARLREREQLAAAVALIAAELEAGTAVPAALHAAADLAPAHADQLRAAARAGEPPEFAGGGLAALGHGWRLAATTGVPLAEVCRRVATDLAAAREQGQAVGSALAGARASAALLAVLPVLGLALGSAMQADPVGVLVATPSGHVVCLVGVCLDAAGLLWTHWLTARAEGP